MKICFKCHIKKELSEFYKHAEMADGYLNKCKTCSKSDANITRKSKIEYYRSYDRLRGSLPFRVKSRQDYSKTESYKISHAKAVKKWIENNKEKRAAHILLNNAIQSGKIQKQNCKLCGSKKSQAHHEDYTKPLKVKWLCQKCHTFRHKTLELKKNA